MKDTDKKAFKQFIDDLTDCVSQTRFDKETLKEWFTKLTPFYLELIDIKCDELLKKSRH